MNITTIQEVLFDLYDAEQSGLLRFSPDADWPQEFATANEWVREQIEKLESVECSISDEETDANTLLSALEALLADHKRMFNEAHPHSAIEWQECVEVRQSLAAIAKAKREAEQKPNR